MLRFRLGPIPVEVHPSHFLMAIAFGSLGLSDRDPSVWPGQALASHDGLTHVVAVVAVVAIWVVIVFVSVLVHELGHALVSLAYHYRPSIQLVGLGGLTRPNAPGPIPWHREVVLTAAGPLMGAALGGLCLLARNGSGNWEVARYTLTLAALANFFWAVVNLMPVLPLDGGRISQAVLGQLFGRAGLIAAQVLALVVCAAIIYFSWGNFLLTLFFLLFAVQAVRTLGALWRGEGTPTNSAELQQLDALFRSGDLKAARERAEVLASQDSSPVVRSRAHHLLGWIALKEGEGRRALDHFSQVQGRGVEKQALAAAFSLVGDDSRALPLWQQAYEGSRDPTILHEWAGALLRSGQVEQASKLPGVDLGKAYACAERVAFLRGNFTRAAELGLSALDRHPSPEAAYDVACALARAGELDRAVLVLERARDLGFSDLEYARTDADLAALHGHPGFERWLALGKSAPA
jgi:tetratricopeptide (TPR) repeat protein